MAKPRIIRPDTAPALAPGEMPRSSPASAWIVVGLTVIALIAALVASPQLDGVRSSARTLLDSAMQPPPPAATPVPHGKERLGIPKGPAVQAQKASPPTAPPSQPSAQYDDRARPVAFYFARWGVNETLSPIGWTSRIEIRATATGGAVAKVWITCPKGTCEAGELPVNVVAHLQKKDMTAFIGIERREADRVWSLLLRPAPGRPDELERMEWYGPPGSNVRTQSLLGHVRRMRADWTFY